MSTPILIGIGGLLRSGKDTVADHLVEHHGFVKMGMSEPLNDAMLTLNPWISLDHHVWDIPFEGGPVNIWWRRGQTVKYQALHEWAGYTKAKEQKEVREFLQLLGTDVGRNMISDTVWVDIAQRNAVAHLKAGRSVILTGMRFPNELTMIEKAGGATVWVDRSAPDLITPGGSVAGTYAHASENSVRPQDFKHILLNHGSLEELYDLAEALISRLTTLNPVISPVQVDSTWPKYDH